MTIMAKKYRVEAAYSEEYDITTILEVCEFGDKILSTEVVGFYEGKPNSEATAKYYGKLKAEYGTED